jgi:protein-S-isoprenylcysteine O-methyltransferase Ste14
MAPVIRTLIFTVIVPGFWTVFLPWWLARGGHLRLHWDALAALGWLLTLSGAALYLMCAFWGFALRGGGTPAPIDPPKKLVIVGPYRVVRNPMYWAVFSVMLGEAALLRSAPQAQLGVFFFLGTCVFVLVYEEPVLRASFGAEYEEYCRRVPRWLPRLRKSS